GRCSAPRSALAPPRLPRTGPRGARPGCPSRAGTRPPRARARPRGRPGDVRWRSRAVGSQSAWADPPWPKISRIRPIAPCRCGRRSCIVSGMVGRRIAIIGSGFSGLCLGIRLKQAGIDRFRGACFHSARWDHAHDLAGKRVGVIGNAASAIQFIPRIAPKVRHLSIFQRSANWMLPRGDRAYTERERRWLTRFPLLARLHRWSIWLRLELRFPMIRGNRFFAWMARRAAEQNLRDHVADPRLRAALTPDYPI